MRESEGIARKTITRRAFLAASGGALASACATTGPRGAGQERLPNIVVILADDFGVGDIRALDASCAVPTPHLDGLAGEGVVFTDAHSASAVCSTSRYGLLTGRYCWRTRLQEWVLDAYEPPLIAADRLTLPGMLRGRGYATACIGKWHLGWDWSGEGEGIRKKPDFTIPIASGPTTRGFDYYFGTDVPNYPPYTFIENDRILVQPTEWNKADKEMVLGYNNGPMAPGWRYDHILPTLTEKAVAYVHAKARGEAPFFLYYAMTSPHEPIAPSEAFRGKSGIAPIADFLMETDRSAGQVIRALEDAGVADNTLVIFAGDNGHSDYTGWGKLVARGHRPSGPYRGWKGQLWEGGHRVPFIVRWPGHTKAGTRNDRLICLNDVMATCAAIVGEQLPENAAEDSVNMLAALTGSESGALREAVVHHDVRGAFGMREGPWKLIILAEREAEPGFELYNLDEDPAETRDLSGAHPEIVRRLLARLDSYVEAGRSTPGAPQSNDTPDIDVRHLPKQRWGRPK